MMLYKITEIADLFVDACLRNESGDLMFLSVYGRDTALQQFLAAMQLKQNEGGITRFSLKPADVNNEPASIFINVGNPDRFEKFSGRMPKENLFGNLSHLWIYDPVLIKPDKATKTGWVLLDQSLEQTPVNDHEAARSLLNQGIWALYKKLSPVPLLEDWEAAVTQTHNAICVTWMSETNYPPIGQIAAARLVIDDEFSGLVSSMIKSGQIGLRGELINVRTDARCKGAEKFASHAKSALKPFLSTAQYQAMLKYCKGEEGEFFESKFEEMADRIKIMPKTYETEKTADPVVTLHYFLGGSDWYIIEKDMEDGVSQAFGYAILNGDLMCAELGYISITELVETGLGC
jgi:hypothetical protein